MRFTARPALAESGQLEVLHLTPAHRCARGTSAAPGAEAAEPDLVLAPGAGLREVLTHSAKGVLHMETVQAVPLRAVPCDLIENPVNRVPAPAIMLVPAKSPP